MTDAVVKPSEFADFQRRETTLILLNLGVIAALVTVHVAFIGCWDLRPDRCSSRWPRGSWSRP